MTENLSRWWVARSQREQRLLLVMGGLLAVVLAWLLVVRPLGDRLSEARERHGAAVVALAEAKASAAAIGRLERVRHPPLDGPPELVIGREANQAGFRVSRLQPEGAGRVTVAMESARPQAFFAWVRAMEADKGLIVDRLSASSNSDRTLSVQVTFRARGG
jgi:general secretion pathway protein M